MTTARMRPKVARRTWQRGLTLLELMAALAIATLLLAALGGLVGSALQLQAAGQARNALTQEARFAMQKMTMAVQDSRRLMLPLADNPATSWSEHIRVQTVPASPPQGSSTLATAVLAVTLSPRLDTNGDGWADANNDKDFLDRNQNSLRDPGEPERIDEDLSVDNTNDGTSGIYLIDDDGDGSVDESGVQDNDEQGGTTEDSLDGIDNDGDGSVDEDISGNMNFDSKPGIANVDDDLDGNIDEGPQPDDDEDGQVDEDHFDPVVYYLSGNQLMERWPSLIDLNADTLVNGRDFTQSVIASNITLFRIERVALGNGRAQLVDITLTLTNGKGEQISLRRQVRLGSGL